MTSGPTGASPGTNNQIYADFYLYFTGTQNAEAIWNALLKLCDLYPAEPTVVAR
jgi:hypothetical protein